jgi:hypothetical protein
MYIEKVECLMKGLNRSVEGRMRIYMALRMPKNLGAIYYHENL